MDNLAVRWGILGLGTVVDTYLLVTARLEGMHAFTVSCWVCATCCQAMILSKVMFSIIGIYYSYLLKLLLMSLA